MKTLSILVADDQEEIRALLQHWLEEDGHTVSCVASAKEAGRQITGKRFDLVITDVLMPDGDGLELIAQLKKSQPATRILAISGGGRYMEGNDCLRIAKGFGAHVAVMKPFNRQQLFAGVETALAAPASEVG